MGAVYRGLDVATGEPVAVKVLALGSADALERFRFEVRLLSEISNPRIVRYVAHGETPSGEPYLAMEWLEGEDLATRLERRGLTVSESIDLITQVAEALAEPHARGIVHRDIKPSNL